MNVLNQDPYLPPGVTNAMAENEPIVIMRCSVCGEDICKGDWIYHIGCEVICTDRQCLVKLAPYEDYALEFCLEDDNIKDFVSFIDLRGWLLYHEEARLINMLVNDDGDKLHYQYAEELIFEFAEWLEKKGEIKNEIIRDS